jgi:hypothetical protein
MREFVKEQEIYKRERLVNLRILPYVLSKVWVAALLAIYQAAVYTIVHHIAFDMPGGFFDFFQIFITMILATLAGMMLGLFASALAPNASSAPLLVILLMLPQIVLGGALVPLPGFLSAPTSTRWAFEALMGITGMGSDIAADVCWALPADVREAMTLEDKEKNNCRCLGANALREDSCNFPGLGKFYNPAVDQSAPLAPPELGLPPPEPVLPERPIQPLDQSDNVAMAEFFQKLQAWEAEATAIQEQYKQQLEAFQAKSEVYKSEAGAYAEAVAQWQAGRGGAIVPAEVSIAAFHKNLSWTIVDKENPAAYWSKIGFTWVVQSAIILILFGAILFLQKRKDIT